MDLIQVINELQTEYKKLFNRFSVQDIDDPISPEKISASSRYLNEWHKNTYNYIVEFGINNEKHLKENIKLANDHNNDLKVLSDRLNRSVKQLTQDYEKATSLLSKDNENEREKLVNKIRDLKQDAEWESISFIQKKEILGKEFEVEKKRYNYQFNSSKESYVFMVSKYNKSLETKKKEIEDNYQTIITDYLEDYENIIAKFNSLIKNATHELNNLNSLLNNERNIMKEKNLQESKHLNEQIKKISEDKNASIDASRNEHSKALSDSNIERENKRQNYQNESQALLKNFVTTISKIDENISNVKKELDAKSEEIKRNHFFNLHSITKEYHDDIIKLRNENSPNMNRLIKKRTKSYFKVSSNLKKETELMLTQLSKQHTKTIEEFKNDKNYLEIDKNYALKRLAEQESYDNKYYQEISDIFENDASLNIKNANYHFNQKANFLRCQSQIRNKLLERNFDGLDASYSKQIETTNNKIHIYSLEIKLIEYLKEIIKVYQEKTYYNNLHYEEVINLLEIEKNKILKDLNEDKYNINIESILIDYNYGIRKQDIQNEKEISLCELYTKLESLETEKRILNNTLKIENEKLIEEYSKLKIKGNYNFDIEKAKRNYNYSLYKNDYTLLDKTTSLYQDIYSRIIICYQKFLEILFKDITPTEETIQYLTAIYNNVNQIFISAFQNVNNSYVESISKILDKRINYIDDFVYTPSFKAIEKEFNTRQTELKERISTLLDQIDSHRKTIENFKQKIFNLVNDNEMLRNYKKGKSKKLPSDIQYLMKNNLSKIKEYREKQDNFTKMVILNNEDVEECNNIQRELNRKYSKEYEQLKRQRYKDTKHHIKYQRDIQITINNINRNSTTLYDKGLITTKPKNFVKQALLSKKKLIGIINHTKAKILDELNYFSSKAEKENDDRNMIGNLEYKKFNHSYYLKYNKAFNTFNNQSNKQLNELEEKIATHKNTIDNTINNYDNLLNTEEENYKLNGKNLKIKLENKTNLFYKKYYALVDNFNAIIKHHNQEKKQIETEYERLKNQKVKKILAEKNDSNKKLSIFIKTKNEEIQNLPIAFKYNSRLLNKENKSKNNDINVLIKTAKNDHNDKKKKIDKKLTMLKLQYNQGSINNEINHQRDLKNEKSKNKVLIKQKIKTIKATL